MKRIVRLTESDLARIVRRVMNEAPTATSLGLVKVTSASVTGVHGPGELITGTGRVFNFSESTNANIFSVTVTVTEEGKKLGLDSSMLKIKTPVTVEYWNESIVQRNKNKNSERYTLGSEPTRNYREGTYTFTFTAPTKRFTNTTGKYLYLFEMTFNTNDSKNPDQTVKFGMSANSQFGVGGAQTPVSKN